MLLGRELECAAIGRLLDDARTGASGGLLLRGEAGIGKTALVEYAVEQAAGMLVVRAQGVQSEAEVAFGGLLEVARPLLARIDELPERQAGALRAALALDAGPSPDRLTVGAATLSLLAAAAEETPLLVALDDAQWLDAESADAVGFAVRRLQAERVAVVVATRVGEGRGFDPAGLGAIDLSGLSREAAGELLALNGMPGEEAAARFHALTGGNPLALLELPRWLGAQEASGGGRLDAPVRLGDHLEAAFAARAEVLGAGANEALLVLAASSTEDAAAIATALGAAGLSPAHLEPAEDAGLIRISLAAIRFRHPLVRSALYHSAAPSKRRRPTPHSPPPLPTAIRKRRRGTAQRRRRGPTRMSRPRSRGPAIGALGAGRRPPRQPHSKPRRGSPPGSPTVLAAWRLEGGRPGSRARLHAQGGSWTMQPRRVTTTACAPSSSIWQARSSSSPDDRPSHTGCCSRRLPSPRRGIPPALR